MIFNEIPSNIKIPSSYLEFDSSLAGSSNTTRGVLIVGQKNDNGSAPPSTLIPIESSSNLELLFGKNSELYKLTKAFISKNTTERIWASALPHAAGYYTSFAVQLAIKNSSDSILQLQVVDTTVSINVTKSDTLDTLNDKVIAAINAAAEPIAATLYTSSDDSKSVRLTSTLFGASGTDLNIKKIGNNPNIEFEVNLASRAEGYPELYGVLNLIDTANIHYLVTTCCDNPSLKLIKTKADQAFEAMSEKSFRVMTISKKIMFQI